MSGWIPVDSNLPIKKMKVLTYNADFHEFDVAYHDVIRGKPYWLSKNGFWAILVTHWQPLPNAPKIKQAKEIK